MSDDSPQTNPTLLNRLRNPEDDTSWQEFFDIYWGLIYAFARSRGCDQTLANDIAQETLIAFMSEAESFRYRPAKGRFRSYLMTIANHAIIDRRRRERRFVDPPGSNEAAAWIEQLADEDAVGAGEEWDRRWQTHLLGQALRRVRRRVAERTFEAFCRSVLEERPVDEVCADFDLNPNALYQVRNRLIRMIRAEVNSLRFELGETA